MLRVCAYDARIMASKKTARRIRPSVGKLDPGITVTVTRRVLRTLGGAIRTALADLDTKPAGRGPRKVATAKKPVQSTTTPRKVAGHRRSSDEIKALEQRVRGVIAAHPDIRAKAIAEKLGLAAADIREAIQRLRKLKAIRVSGGNKQATTYAVIDELPAEQSTGPVA